MRSLVERHYEHTRRETARALLADWDIVAAHAFRRVAPRAQVARCDEQEGTVKGAKV